MKIKALLLLSFLILQSCGERKNEAPKKFKYKVGDVVYLKPDSIKATVMELYNQPNSKYSYMVKRYSDDAEEYVNDFVTEFEIYGK